MDLIAAATADTDSGYATRVKAGHHDLTSDEPPARGGTDTGPSPTALLLAALAACTSITMRMYAEKKKWELGHIHVRVRQVKADGAEHIEREITCGAALTEDQRARLAEVAGKTPVTRTVKSGMALTTRLL
ncbi:MAG: OsmC family peroxiredoxin [Deltaproteobacteria bacterium]|nr:MAG: OsmC family peroxiredoxin [Deltaproteobacteria bacterium]